MSGISEVREIRKVICLFKMVDSNANSWLLNYDSPDWRSPLFINVSLPDNEEDDERVISEHIASRLNVSTRSISLRFNRHDESMYTRSLKETKDADKAAKYGPEAYYNFYYCVVKVADPPRVLREMSFAINGIRYRWVRLAELKEIPEARESNYDVLEFLSTRFDASLLRLETSFSDLIFCIMSFSPDMDDVFEGIKSVGESLGFSVRRVKDVEGDYRISDKIEEMIDDAKLVVADLSHERPNVYFELGYARGIGKVVVTVARSGTILPFDVKDWTCLFYGDSRELERRLRARLESVFMIPKEVSYNSGASPDANRVERGRRR